MFTFVLEFTRDCPGGVGKRSLGMRTGRWLTLNPFSSRRTPPRPSMQSRIGLRYVRLPRVMSTILGMFSTRESCSSGSSLWSQWLNSGLDCVSYRLQKAKDLPPSLPLILPICVRFRLIQYAMKFLVKPECRRPGVGTHRRRSTMSKPVIQPPPG